MAAVLLFRGLSSPLSPEPAVARRSDESVPSSDSHPREFAFLSESAAITWTVIKHVQI